MAFNFKQGESAVTTYIVLVVLIVLSLVLVTSYAREGDDGALHSLQGGISGVFTPVKAASGGVSAVESTATTAASDATADANTLSELRDQNSQLRDEISQLEEYRQEAQRLQDLLNLKDQYALDGVTSRVLSRSTDAWNNVITIDKGTDDGIQDGQAVIGSSGLVGQVIAVTGSSADVRLLEDPSFGCAAMIQSNRAEGILKGSLDGLLYLEDVDSSAEVNAGDVVITSGLGGGFYRGILIGTVVKVDGQQGDTNRRIIVEPNDTTGPLEEVMVVTSMNSADDSGSGNGGSNGNNGSNSSNS